MPPIDVSDKLRTRFMELITKCGAVLQAEPGGSHTGIPGFNAAEDVFFDLDRLWHYNDCLVELVKIVYDVAKQLHRKTKFDVIVPIVSAVGSFGPTPWAGVLAREMKKPLVVLDEVEFGNLSSYPLTLSSDQLFTDKRVLLLKDVVVGATSVQRATKLIADHGGEVVALMALVDKSPIPGRVRYDFRSLQDLWYAVLLEYPLRESLVR